MSEIKKNENGKIKIATLLCMPIVLFPLAGMVIGVCNNDAEKCNHPHNVENTGYPNPNQPSTTITTSTGSQGPQGGVSGYSGGYGGSPLSS